MVSRLQMKPLEQSTRFCGVLSLAQAVAPGPASTSTRGRRTQDKIKKHRALFRKLWANFVKVAEVCLLYDPSNVVAFEWPAGCLYWQFPEVQAFLNKWSFKTTTLHGCAYGLRSILPARKGKYIKKPWKIATTSPILAGALSRKCPGNHQHVPCEGDDTLPTQTYTWTLTNAIHDAHALHCRSALHN